MAPTRGSVIRRRKRFTVAALAGLLALGGGFAATQAADPVYAPAAGTMRVGGMVVRLEQFVELRDGTVQAQMSFRNTDSRGPASVALNMNHADEIGELLAARHAVMRLVNASGAEYHLRDISRMGDGQTPGDWVSVAPGSTVFLSASFAPDGAARGVQPFALSIPIRMTWHPDGTMSERTSSFEINFRGLHRNADDVQAAPIARIEPVSLQPAAKPVITPSAPAPQITAAAFNDDLAPLVAKLPATRPDSHRYLFSVGIDQYDDAPNVPFADRSARLMADLLRKRYGVPEENMMVITGADATGMKILGRLNTLVKRLTSGDTVYFYYAGHGLAARDGNAVYVVPKDAVPGAYEVEQLSLSALLHRFEESPATRVVAFLDTCFSGRVGQHESLFPGISPLIPEPAAVTPPSTSGKTTLFLAGQDYQFANEYPEHGHRLFSYFLMRGLLEGHDDPVQLQDFVAREVRRVSAKRGADFVQEPQLRGASLSLASPNTQSRRLY